MYNHQLDTFIQVAELGSFSKAASSLYISPTAVIKQMNILESNLGITLFNRTHQGLTLTSAGQSLLSCKMVAWGYEAPFGIMHAPEPSDKVQRLLDVVGAMVSQRD